ncbi:MalY/PatB family protein [Larsenimonas suaedae]|uniref:cysteine-S-conjugate beta-lyase n=1 Tax=Larsenimonas suaedae TaxID=1851019 RepID=A0ABU1GXN8_9GAMM|nr:PatB family C-S lyase [Larsenimonas suaedae]MCM2973168.1 PatB family C-S lyase [Larsenimonas suaedae]MDR5896605.1 PatB family C-S lyase [Larsenimonas suaedae]
MASERTDFDFTTVTTRRHMGSTKWSRFDEDVLPLWVADMDFRSPEPVIEALEARVKHGVFGYTFASDALKRTLCDWSARHYGLTLEPAWQHWLPGVVPALHIAAQALTELGDDILTLTPIYPPFLHIAENVGRHTQTAALRAPTAEDPQWRLDITALERAITPRTRMLLLCHPHNPTGHVFDSQELAELAALVERYDLWVCSDELHCDLIHDTGRAHVPLIKAEPRLAERTITLWAPSKTFNVAGLTSACAVIADDGLRKRFKRACLGLMPSDNVMGLVAAQAAFEHGEPWRQALLDVLAGNAELIDRYVAAWPGVSWAKPESTYLGWLDLREAGLGDVPQKALLDKARVGLSDGADFGWPGFVRINFGTSLETLQAALERMDTVLR